MENLIIPRKLQSLETHIFIKELMDKWLQEREVTLKNPKVGIIFESDKDIITLASNKNDTYIMEEKTFLKNVKIVKELCVTKL